MRKFMEKAKVKPISFGIACWIAWVFLGTSLPEASGQTKKRTSATKVKVTAKGNTPNPAGLQQVNVTIAIQKDWYIYANPSGIEIPVETKITIQGQKAKLVRVYYPKGQLVSDNGFSYKVYKNSVTIPVLVQRSPGINGPLEITVRINACHTRGFCLPAGTAKVVVP